VNLLIKICQVLSYQPSMESGSYYYNFLDLSDSALVFSCLCCDKPMLGLGLSVTRAVTSARCFTQPLLNQTELKVNILLRTSVTTTRPPVPSLRPVGILGTSRGATPVRASHLTHFLYIYCFLYCRIALLSIILTYTYITYLYPILLHIL
jgi:hypothetical protein